MLFPYFIVDYFLLILILILVVFGVYVAFTSSPVILIVTSCSPSLYPDKSTIAFIFVSSIEFNTSLVPLTMTVVFIDYSPIAAAL